MMTEENETVHQIEHEMRRMLNIIAEDQEVINHKDKQIISLQNSLKEKDEFLKTECADLSHTKVDIEDLLKKRVHEKDLEVSKVREDMKSITEELENEILQLKVEIEEQDKTIEKSFKMEVTQNKQAEYIQDTLKLKVEELMKIIEEKNLEIEQLKGGDEIPKVIAARNDILQKEMLVLKVSLQQKDSDIKSLNELIERKEDIISQNDSTIELYLEELNQLKRENEKSKEAKGNEGKTTDSDTNEKIIQSLQQKIVHEQETHKQTEDELIKLKIDFENSKQDLGTPAEREESVPKGSQASLMKSKDEEIERLKKEILQEQQIISHVQVTQEKEIIEKEKEILILNTILSQERNVLLEKNKEIENLLLLKNQVK